MPFIPHTDREVEVMLETIGVDSLEALFDEIPAELRLGGELDGVPPAAGEAELRRAMYAFARRDADPEGPPLCFLGAGAYDHHVPSAVWQVVTRGEYYSAYTPYQAEASQGTLQLIYEYQTMMAGLTGMDVSNASLYDGASALAEAVLMAVRANRKSRSRRVLVAGTVHPVYRACVRAIVRNQGIELVELPFDEQAGTVSPERFQEYAGDDIAGVIVQQPNFFGGLEAVDALTDWAHENGALMIAVANPVSLALLKPPGEWGGKGADIACGDGQPLGVPLASGGPYYGYMCCRQDYVRQMPGRIVGRTVDLEGREGFVLTLQAREQHIRRSKATSNICTNQGLVVAASTVYMSIMGPEGLRRVAAGSHANTADLVRRLVALPGVEPLFDGPFFHECALRLDRPADPVLDALAERGILGGLNLAEYYPDLDRAMLVCATELRTEADLARYEQALADVLNEAKA